MEQRALKHVNNCLNTNIYSHLETSGGQSSSLYLNVVNFFNTHVHGTAWAYAFSLIIEGTTEKVLQLIMPLKSIYNQNLGFIGHKNVLLNTTERFKCTKSIN
jgi:hypothetical protein